MMYTSVLLYFLRSEKRLLLMILVEEDLLNFEDTLQTLDDVAGHTGLLDMISEDFPDHAIRGFVLSSAGKVTSWISWVQSQRPTTMP